MILFKPTEEDIVFRAVLLVMIPVLPSRTEIKLFITDTQVLFLETAK